MNEPRKGSEIVALTAVFVLPSHAVDAIKAEVSEVLKRNDAQLLAPCGWSPDPDTIAECLDGTPFGMVRVVDLNP
jgi:hypothetical protein